MGLGLLRVEQRRQGLRAIPPHGDLRLLTDFGLGGQDQSRLTPAHQFGIDLGQNLRVHQGAMLRAA